MRMLSRWPQRGLTTDLFDEMDRAFEGLMSSSNFSEVSRSYPVCDVTENDSHFFMSFDLPGMKIEDIKIELNKDVLTVSGERKRESQGESDKMQRFERSYGFFKRSFSLPSSVDADKIEAHYDNGVLELAIPKAASAKVKNVEIQSGKGGFLGRLFENKKPEVSRVDEQH